MVTSIRASSTAEPAGRAFRHPAAVMARLARNKAALASLGGVILPYNPDTADLNAVLHPPTLAHPFGTDQLGRDILTRVVYGGRISLMIGVLAVGVSALLGVPLGVVSGFYGGLADVVIQRVVDVLLAFPG